MSGVTFAHSTAPLKTIKEIQFGLFSPEEIKNMSVVHVEYPEAIDEQKRTPREKGVNDPKMGTTDRSFVCGTCGEGMSECPGHFGHIELASPVFHIGFLTKTKKLLETCCHNCGKILVDESDSRFIDALRHRDPKKRFDAIHRLAKMKDVCETDPEPSAEDGEKPKDEPVKGHGGCGNRVPQIRKEGLKLIGNIKPKKKDEEEEDQRMFEKRPITPLMALNAFRRISTEDCRKLGLSNDYARPEWMIITVLPVPPPPVRPSIVVDGGGGGMRGEDDLTYKLSDIIRANANVRRCEQEGSPQHVINEFEALLQFHVATYMDNNIAGQPQALQKSGRPIKAIRSRLKGKEGRLRGNLMGKRVDFSARTVITGDPNISLHEVGVPESIARILTYPETVTAYNIDKLTKLVRNGPNLHPGAKYVIRDDGQRIDLRHHKRLDDITLSYGWKVERHLNDGDYILFNRQPSLHKESMMGHQVRILPYSTFRLNLSVTSPYNADFDGDEMNLHVPQSEETRSEIQNLCLVPHNIVSPQNNRPLMGIVQDSLCGIYKICDKNVFLSKDEVMTLLFALPNWDGIIPAPAIIKPRPRWTGKQMVSQILPKINLMRGEDLAPLHERGDTCLHIRDGDLIFGMMAKAHVGATAGGVVHTIFNLHGPWACVEFFNGAQRLTNNWLFHNGFSVGIGDTVPSETAIAKINKAVEEAKAKVQDLTEEAVSDRMELLPGMSLRETFESHAKVPLNDARECINSKDLKPCNNVKTMSDSGSKGSKLNIAQMTALVGQQSVEGNRMPFGFKYRTLPHFCKDDYSPEACGFVENSYLRGLTPTEFFFHAMSGREGLIDTAVKTAETGYIQRRLVKALEDVSVRYDTTVRNSLGDIVQFVYGEDGLDPVHIEKQKIDIIRASHKQFDRKFKVNLMDPNTGLRNRLEQAEEIIGDAQLQLLLDREYEAVLSDRMWLRSGVSLDDDESFQLPLNIRRIIEEAKNKFDLKGENISDLHPRYVIEQVEKLLDGCKVIRGDDPLSQAAQENCTLLFKILVRSQLAFKRVVVEYQLNKLAFDDIIYDIGQKFRRSQANPGEMVGVVAAQSIGEPATQMTLNTFHFTGISAKNVTLGVPRLKEILNAATHIKTPSMKIFQDGRKDRDGAMALRSKIEHTTLRTVTARTEIYYDPVIESSVIEADRDMVESYYIIPEDVEETVERQSKWMMRIVLNRKMLLDKNITAQDVAAKIKEEYQRDLAVIFSDDNADEQVVRIRMLDQDFEKDPEADETETDHTLKRLEAHMLDTLTLRGVPGISRAYVAENVDSFQEPDGRLVKDKKDPRCNESYLQTQGISLKQVLAVDGVDATRTTCNQFLTVVDVLGIEGARSALLRELIAVLSFDGSYVNHRHMALLADVMTARGFIMAVTRHGINRADTGALMRCSFEETVEILLDAAACGELDDCRGISENVLLGQMAPLGTGHMDIMLDQDMLNTVTSDNAARMGFISSVPGGAMSEGAATPYDIGSPLQDGFNSPDYSGAAAFSPLAAHGVDDASGGFTAYGGDSYGGGFASPYGGSNATSPYGGATSPFTGAGAASPAWSPTSPGYSPTSPGYAMGGTSPAYALTSPGYTSPTSPAFGSSTSPAWSPTSPAAGNNISPTSPAGYSPTSPNYSPTSPNYSPTSPRGNEYSPASPAYSPTSPQFSPTSPRARPAGRGQQTSPTSPAYSPTSPAGAYSPTSPNYSPASPQHNANATSPQWTPTSPAYSPTSPKNP